MTIDSYAAALHSAVVRIGRTDGTVDEYTLGVAGSQVRLAEQVHVFTAWHPFGERTTAANNDACFRELQRELAAVAPARAQVIDARCGWAVPALAVSHIDHEQARDLVQRYMQPYVIELGRRGCTLRSTGVHPSLGVSGLAHRRLGGWPCPMRDLEAADGEPCDFGRVRHYLAANARVLWDERRVMMLRTASCDVCHDNPRAENRSYPVKYDGERFDFMPGDNGHTRVSGWWAARARISARLPYTGDPTRARVERLLAEPVPAAAFTVDRVLQVRANVAPPRPLLPRTKPARYVTPAGPTVVVAGTIEVFLYSDRRVFVHELSVTDALPSRIGLGDLSDVHLG